MSLEWTADAPTQPGVYALRWKGYTHRVMVAHLEDPRGPMVAMIPTLGTRRLLALPYYVKSMVGAAWSYSGPLPDAYDSTSATTQP